MDVGKRLTHFCYPIRLVLHQHLNSHESILVSHLKNQTTHFSDYSDQSLTKLIHLKGFSSKINLILNLAQLHCKRIIKHGHHLRHNMRNLIQ